VIEKKSASIINRLDSLRRIVAFRKQYGLEKDPGLDVLIDDGKKRGKNQKSFMNQE